MDTAAIKTSEIIVERRSIYTPGGRGKARAVYDARGKLHGVEYSVCAPTKAEAVALAKRDIAYVSAAGSFEAGGCKVTCNGFESWCFELPGTVPGRRGCAMVFGAADLASAIARAAGDYREHPEAQEFCAAAGCRVQS